MVQNNDRAELVNALKCLRDDNLSRLQIDILLNADEEDLIRAYYDMDGEFSCSKCCNTENPYLSIPLEHNQQSPFAKALLPNISASMFLYLLPHQVNSIMRCLQDSPVFQKTESAPGPLRCWFFSV